MANSKTIHLLLGVLSITTVLAIAPSAFADSTEVDIAKGAGASANADCVNANNCFNPNPVTVSLGSDVEWKNTDTVGHTVTSGKPTDNDAGSIFDSGIIKAGSEFKFTFPNAGTFDYFCQVHPWMTGQVIVSSGTPSTTSAPTTTTSAPTTTTSAPTTTTSAPTTTTSAPTTTTSAPTTTTSAPTTTTDTQSSGDEMTGWGAGIAIIAIMSGIGIWSAVRKH